MRLLLLLLILLLLLLLLLYSGPGEWASITLVSWPLDRLASVCSHIGTDQDYPTGNSTRRETKRQTEETMGRQHQRVDWP